jgi:hypothetical protein
MADQWYYSEQGQQKGPLAEEELKQLALAGQLKPTMLVWKRGMTQWTQANQVDGLFPPPTPPDPDAPPPIPDSLTSPPPVTYGTGEASRTHPKTVLEKCYFPFQITLLVIFALGLFTLGFSYYYGPFAVAIGFAICNFIAGLDNRLGTSPWDLIIMILAAVSLVPFVGWITQIVAMILSLIALLKYLEHSHPASCVA